MMRKHLYAVAAVIWGIPGITITLKGISAYGKQPSENLWWLLLITASVLAAFFMMFRRIVDRYCGRIASLPANGKSNLIAIPEIVEVYCTNEAYDLFVKIYARNNDHLLTLIQTQIKPLGLIMSKIIISFRTVYNKQLTILPK